MLDAGDYFSDLTTAPIFDDAVYQLEALCLPDGQNEEDLDEQLAISAREAGIDDPYRFLCAEGPDSDPDRDLSTAVSTLTVSSERASSMSVHSRETQSTGATSYPSRTSKDQVHSDQSSTLRSPPPLTRGSFSLDSYDAVMDRFRPTIRHRYSTSNASGTNSLRSTASSLPKPSPTPRKQKRTSGLFAMFRRDTSACPSPSHQGYHGKPSSPKLECGHVLSKYAIRVHVQDAIGKKQHVLPSCCGKPLPRPVLEAVLTKEETELVTSDALLSPVSSQRDSGYSEDGLSSIELPRTLATDSYHTRSFVNASRKHSGEVPREEEDNLDLALPNEDFTKLKTQQKEQFQRVSSFESNQKKALSAYHQWSLKRLDAQFETSKAEKTKQHTLELERLDETQIIAEHDLRKSHAQETQNVATALKYMGAYCSGLNPANPDVSHTVTEEDRKKLASQHMIQAKLPAKHESTINVLRARQEKDLKLKLQKQQAELQQLDTDYERQKQSEELQFLKDSSRLDALMEARRKRVMNRWDLKFEMWRKDWETQRKTALHGRLPHEAWPETPDQEGALDPSSSLALYLQPMG